MTTRDTDTIRQLNDSFRTSGASDLGTWVMTPEVSGARQDFVATAIGLVREFDTFTPDNDPHGEHDFGLIKIGSRTLYWKIDYYDRALEYGSENPADPAVTHRVLTIMLAEEY